MKISVTQHDIDDGVPSDSGCCPIANCLHRMFPFFDSSVEHKAITIGDHTFPHTDESRRFMDAFDDYSEDITPFEFELPTEEAGLVAAP